MTILPPSKHLAHKVWVGFPEAVEVLPSGVVRALAIPADQQLDKGTVVFRPGAAIQNLNRFGAKNAVGVHRW